MSEQNTNWRLLIHPVPGCMTTGHSTQMANWQAPDGRLTCNHCAESALQQAQSEAARLKEENDRLRRDAPALSSLYAHYDSLLQVLRSCVEALEGVPDNVIASAQWQEKSRAALSLARPLLGEATE